MKTTDLRHSNTIYILRAIADGSYNVDELAAKTQMSQIAVKKILYELCKKEILIKYKNLDGLQGRPRTSFNFNPLFHCTLINKEDSKYSVKLINGFGQKLREFSFPISYQGLNCSNSLKMLNSTLKTESVSNYNLATFLIGENLSEVSEIPNIYKTSVEQLILDSLYDETLVIYCEIGQKRFLHNYGKIKEITISDTQLKDIIDLDFIIKLDNENNEEHLIEALRLITLMKLEEKI